MTWRLVQVFAYRDRWSGGRVNQYQELAQDVPCPWGCGRYAEKHKREKKRFFETWVECHACKKMGFHGRIDK